MYNKICIVCNKEVFRTGKQGGNKSEWKFCSHSCCATYYNKIRTISDKPNYITGYKKCLYCKKDFPYRDNLKVRGVGKIGYINQKFCSKKCALTFRNKTEKQQLSVPRGDKHWAWSGGKSLSKFSATSLFRSWRKKVFERDDYTCQFCKIRGGKLNAHHIKEVLSFPELSQDINNGITLCIDCHRKTDNWGIKSVWRNRKKIFK